MTPDSTISLEALGILFAGIVAFWGIMAGILTVWKEHRDNRILLLAVCRHLGINVEEIIGKQ